MKNKFAFTLIELVITIIVIGTLTMLALPKLIGYVEYSRSIEAMATMGEIRRAVIRCASAYDTTVNCDMNSLDLSNPSNTVGRHFDYVLNLSATNGEFTVIATRNTLDKGDGTSTISLIQTTSGVSKQGTGAFNKIH